MLTFFMWDKYAVVLVYLSCIYLLYFSIYFPSTSHSDERERGTNTENMVKVLQQLQKQTELCKLKDKQIQDLTERYCIKTLV